MKKNKTYYQSITVHDQNKAIAEHLGCEVLLDKPDFSAATGLACKNMYRIRGKTDWMIMPDWTADLNAMHEAEKSLTPTQKSQYTMILEAVLKLGINGIIFDMVHASAAQRAEAFLKTIDKWID